MAIDMNLFISHSAKKKTRHPWRDTKKHSGSYFNVCFSMVSFMGRVSLSLSHIDVGLP